MRKLLVLLALVLASAAFAQPPKLVSAARQQARSHVVYDGRYVRIGYPMGDVPSTRGVCTDVVIRAYRAIGIDLQVLVHEDMSADFDRYPSLWGLTRPDSNIDHRRVPGNPLIIHNIGAGPVEDDILFAYPITGHYRYRVQ